jgi:hypothetical protein
LLPAMIASLTFAFAGCAMIKRITSRSDTPATSGDDQPLAVAPPASIQITYAKADDTLKSLVVSQFTGATVLRTVNQGDKEAAVVRFDGGVPVWQFHSNRSLLNPLSAIEKTPYHLAGVDYGKLPDGFVQDVPETGPPAPIDPGGYYIFAIERASGVINYQVVKVNPDGSLQAYDAEPRAGTSYKLCCNVSSDFAAPSPSDIEQPTLPTPPAPDSVQP